MSRLKKCLLVALGSLCAVLGVVGVFLPVLPTTPLLLAAAFLFSKSPERLASWLAGTKVYQAYVLPFKERGGISAGRKVRILGISYAVMGLSAALVRRPVVWGVLGVVALFLLWLMAVRIPTVPAAPASGAPQPEAPSSATDSLA